MISYYIVQTGVPWLQEEWPIEEVCHKSYGEKRHD